MVFLFVILQKMFRVLSTLCVLSVLFTLTHSSASTTAPSTCQAAAIISSLSYNFYAFTGIGSPAINPLTTQCSQQASATAEAWFKYIPLIPEVISARTCLDDRSASTITVETTGYEDCTQRSPGICANDNSEPSSASECGPGAGFPSTSFVSNVLLIPKLPYYILLDVISRSSQDFTLMVNQVQPRTDLIPRNDECSSPVVLSFPYSGTGSTMYATPSILSCREDSLPIGDVFYSFSSTTQPKEFVVCATWGIRVSLIDSSYASLCSGRTDLTSRSVPCVATANKGSDGCARITSSVSSGFIALYGDAPLSRGEFTFSANIVANNQPVIISPPDLVRTSTQCSGPAFYGSTGTPTVISMSGNPLRYSKNPKAPYFVGRNLITFTVYDDIAALSSSCVQTLTINTVPTVVCQE